MTLFKVKKMFFVPMLAVMLCVTNAVAKESIAVFDFSSIGCDKNISESVSEIIRTDLIGHSGFDVLERSQLVKLIDEHKLNMTGLIDTDTAVDIGKLVGARIAVVGSVVKLGSVYTINARFVDIETGIAKHGRRTSAMAEINLPDACTDLLDSILGKEEKSAQVVRPRQQEVQMVDPSFSSVTWINNGHYTNQIMYNISKSGGTKLSVRAEVVRTLGQNPKYGISLFDAADMQRIRYSTDATRLNNLKAIEFKAKGGSQLGQGQSKWWKNIHWMTPLKREIDPFFIWQDKFGYTPSELVVVAQVYQANMEFYVTKE